MPTRRDIRCVMAAIALVLAPALAIGDARAADGADPDIAGAWARPGRGGNTAAWDPSKPTERQDAPLTAEYRAVYAASLAVRAAGGQEYNPAINCLPAGLPRIMVAYDPLEIIVTQDITYIRSDHLPEMIRIYTDGRDWPQAIPPAFGGYSIGRWVAAGADGASRALEIESRGMKGPRALDVNGLPLHRDNQTIVKQRLFLDPGDHNVLDAEITVIDHAYTRPWTVLRPYRRLAEPMWVENDCAGGNHYVVIGNETYFISADGHLMPTKRNQPAPGLGDFAPPGKH
jgi:hypothetical protein